MAPQRAISLDVESARIGVDVEALPDQFGVGDGPQVQHRGRLEEAVPLAADVALLEDTGGGQRVDSWADPIRVHADEPARRLDPKSQPLDSTR